MSAWLIPGGWRGACAVPAVLALCAAVGWAWGPRWRALRSLSAVEAIAVRCLVGIVVISWVGTVLALMGVFRPGVILGVLLIGGAAIQAKRRPTRRSSESDTTPDEPRPRAAGLPLVLLVIAAWWVYSRPAESYVTPYDAGVYTLGGIVLAREGTLTAPEPAVFDVDSGIEISSAWDYGAPGQSGYFAPYKAFARQFYSIEGALPVLFRFAGGYLTPSAWGGATSEFPFPPLAKVWSAVFVLFFGEAFAVWWAPLFGVIGLASVYVFCRAVSGRGIAAGTTLLLAVSLPQLWFARFPSSDVAAQAFFFGGLALGALASPGVGPASDTTTTTLPWWGLTLGCLTLLRIEALALIIPAAGVVLLGWRHGMPRGPQALGSWFWLAVPSIVGTFLTILACPLYVMQLYIGAPKAMTVGTVAATAAGLVALSWRWLECRAGRFAERCRERANVAAWMLAIGWLAWAAFAGWQIASVPWSHSLPGWIVQYVSRPALLGGLVGLALQAIHAGRERRLIAAAPSATALVLMMLYSVHPHVTPVHPWAVRRLVPVIFPVLFLGIASGIAWAVRAALRWVMSVRRPAVRHIAEASVCAATAVAWLGLAYLIGSRAATLLWHQERQGLYAQLRALDALLPRGSVVLMDTGTYGAQLAPTMQYLLGHPTYQLRDDAVIASDSVVVDRLVSSARAQGREVYLLATGGPLLWRPRNWDLQPVGGQVVSTPLVLLPRGRPPTAADIGQETFLADLYRVLPRASRTGASVWSEMNVPLSVGSYPYLGEGFYGVEQSPQGAFRWIASHANLSVPWPTLANSTLSSLCIEVQVAAPRPDGLPPARLGVQVEETEAHEWRTVDSGGRRAVSWLVRDVRNEGIPDLEISLTSNTWVPAEETDSRDERQLGVALYGVRLSTSGECPVGD